MKQYYPWHSPDSSSIHRCPAPPGNGTQSLCGSSTMH